MKSEKNEKFNASVAQLAEQGTLNPEVAGSTPARCTKFERRLNVVLLLMVYIVIGCVVSVTPVVDAETVRQYGLLRCAITWPVLVYEKMQEK